MVIKAVIDSRKADKEGLFPVRLRIADKGKSVYCAIGIKGLISEFDPNVGLFQTNNKATKTKNNYNNQMIIASKQRAEDIILKCNLDHRVITAEGVKEIFINGFDSDKPDVIEDQSKLSFLTYFDQIIQTKNSKNAELYQGTVNKIRKFTKGEDVFFLDITSKWLENFDTYMSKEKIESKYKKRTISGLSVNARAVHLKNIRSVLNQALMDEIVSLTIYPFKKFKIKTEETRKRAMKVEDIRKLFAHIGTIQENWAVDMAKAIFFSIGINVKDLFFLSNVDETLSYRRFKTHRLYDIPIEPELQEILDKYMVGDCLIFKKQFLRYESFAKKVNKYLKSTCESIGISKITTYSLRHSWATIANKAGVNKGVIAQALGHGKKTVTDIYILEDIEDIRQANRIVIDFVLNKKNTSNQSA